MSRDHDNPDDTRTRRTGESMPWSEDFRDPFRSKDKGRFWTGAAEFPTGTNPDRPLLVGRPRIRKNRSSRSPGVQVLGQSERTIDEAHQADVGALRAKVAQLDTRLRILEVWALVSEGWDWDKEKTHGDDPIDQGELP